MVGEVGVKKGCMGEMRVLSMVDMVLDGDEFVEACCIKSSNIVVSRSNAMWKLISMQVCHVYREDGKGKVQSNELTAENSLKTTFSRPRICTSCKVGTPKRMIIIK